MDINSLTAIGLTKPQAQAYALLIERGEVTPPLAVEALGITRTNAYKLMDKLVELGLAKKKDINKKITYMSRNPLALTSLSAEFRAQAVAREEAVNAVMHQLMEKYHKHAEQPLVEVANGPKTVAEAYRKQIGLHEDIYFIHTDADIPMMGFDAMHEIRTTPAQHGNHRKGILAAPAKGPINYKKHREGNLEITWAEKDLYNAPVEWSVTRSSLLIVLYATEPHAIFIADPIIAGAFLQLWQLLNGLLKPQPTNKRLSNQPRSANSKPLPPQG